MQAIDYVPSETSLRNYKALLYCTQPNISIKATSISKTNSRYTAENSLISAMAFALVVATTHYMITYNESKEMRDNMSDEET